MPEDSSILLLINYGFYIFTSYNLLTSFEIFLITSIELEDLNSLSSVKYIILLLLGVILYRKYNNEMRLNKSKTQNEDSFVEKDLFYLSEISKVSETKIFSKSLFVQFKNESSLVVSQKDVTDKVLDQKKKYGYKVINFDLQILGLAFLPILLQKYSILFMNYLNLPEAWLNISIEVILFLLCVKFIYSFHFKDQDFGLVSNSIKNKPGGKKRVLVFCISLLVYCM